MGDGNAGIRGRRDGGGDAGDDLKPHAGGHQCLAFLAAAAKNEWVAALEAHDAPAFEALLDQQAVDLVLGHRVAGGLLADVDLLGIGAVAQELRVGQVVVDDDLGRLEEGNPADGEEAGVAGASADEIDDALFGGHGINDS